jgi:hypothetical protein
VDRRRQRRRFIVKDRGGQALAYVYYEDNLDAERRLTRTRNSACSAKRRRALARQWPKSAELSVGHQ